MLKHKKVRGRRGFFKLTWGILMLAVVIYALNILLILQLIPVFEADDLASDIVNLVVFPANFFFEDLLGITSVRIIDILTWVLEFFYAYLIACLLRRLMRVRVRI